MKHKKWLWKLTLPLILAVATVLVPVQSASALATVEGYWGYSIQYPKVSYGLGTDGQNWTGFQVGDRVLDQTTATLVDRAIVSNETFVNTLPHYEYGRSVAYIIARNCTPTTSNFYSPQAILESVDSEPIEYSSKYDQSQNSNQENLNLYQLVYRNDSNATTFQGAIPIGMWCQTQHFYGEDAQMKFQAPLLNMVAFAVYGQYPYVDYSQQLQEIKDAIENGSDAGEVLQNQREEDRQDMENAQSDADDGSNQSSQDISSSTGNFMSSIGAVVGALSSPGTNCNINMNFGILNLGNVNLCQIPTELKTIINTLSSIAITLAVLWTSYKGITTILEQIGNVVNT